ncbi:MAG: type VII toxin-antitoxin system HepT family RNase toxin [Thermoguttaceae bacterium]
MDSHTDVAINKVATIERCINRFREEYAFDPTMKSYTHVDAMILNVKRACQACVDLATHLIFVKRLGNLQTSGDAFLLLQTCGLITEATAKNMVRMVTFCNIAVHQYQSLDTSVLESVATQRWQDMVSYCDELGFAVKVR